MDKSWIDLPDRTSKPFIDGVKTFLDFAFKNVVNDTRIYCPCKKCRNRFFVVKEAAEEHIIVHGFWSKYKKWKMHGELSTSVESNQEMKVSYDSSADDDMIGMIHDTMCFPNLGCLPNNPSLENELNKGPNDKTKAFLKLLEKAESPLYPGYENFTSLSFIVRLLHIKVLSGWTNKSVTMLLKLLKEAFSKEAKLPDSYYEAQKITTDLGFSYKTWDACPNNCMLFRYEYEELNKCNICEASRYKQFGGDPSGLENQDKKIPAKQVRYFPLTPRLQRLFMSSETASFMRWHAESRTKDGVLSILLTALHGKHLMKKTLILLLIVAMLGLD
ncbi:hypothetical protein WN943_019212 [Citrus x changshan-huyou]